MKIEAAAAVLAASLSASIAAADLVAAPDCRNNTTEGSPVKAAQLHLMQEWDKVFPRSDKVNHSKVTFVNRFGITLAADLYAPKNAAGKMPAVAVSGRLLKAAKSSIRAVFSIYSF